MKRSKMCVIGEPGKEIKNRAEKQKQYLNNDKNFSKLVECIKPQIQRVIWYPIRTNTKIHSRVWIIRISYFDRLLVLPN